MTYVRNQHPQLRLALQALGALGLLFALVLVIREFGMSDSPRQEQEPASSSDAGGSQARTGVPVDESREPETAFRTPIQSSDEPAGRFFEHGLPCVVVDESGKPVRGAKLFLLGSFYAPGTGPFQIGESNSEGLVALSCEVEDWKLGLALADRAAFRAAGFEERQVRTSDLLKEGRIWLKAKATTVLLISCASSESALESGCHLSTGQHTWSQPFTPSEDGLTLSCRLEVPASRAYVEGFLAWTGGAAAQPGRLITPGSGRLQTVDLQKGHTPIVSVFDTDGVPIASATVQLQHYWASPGDRPGGSWKTITQATTDGRGQASLSVQPSNSGSWRWWLSAEGYLSDALALDGGFAENTWEAVLSESVPGGLRILDASGDPTAGAFVSLRPDRTGVEPGAPRVSKLWSRSVQIGPSGVLPMAIDGRGTLRVGSDGLHPTRAFWVGSEQDLSYGSQGELELRLPFDVGIRALEVRGLDPGSRTTLIVEQASEEIQTKTLYARRVSGVGQVQITLPFGDYIARVQSALGETSVDFEVPSQHPVALYGPAASLDDFQLRTALGSPLRNTRVRLLDAGGATAYESTSNDEGAVALPTSLLDRASIFAIGVSGLPCPAALTSRERRPDAVVVEGRILSVEFECCLGNEPRLDLDSVVVSTKDFQGRSLREGHFISASSDAWSNALLPTGVPLEFLSTLSDQSLSRCSAELTLGQESLSIGFVREHKHVVSIPMTWKRDGAALRVRSDHCPPWSRELRPLVVGLRSVYAPEEGGTLELLVEGVVVERLDFPQ